MKKNIVVIGGGTGIFGVLRGLKEKDVHVAGVVSMFDSGGSSGILRDEVGVLPPGDIRRCLVALSEGSQEGVLRELFSYRFNKGSLAGYHFGNLFIAALTGVLGDDAAAIRAAGKLLNIRGQALPVSFTNAHLHAELENGVVIEGETNIDVPKHDGALRIEKVFLKPSAALNPEAKKAILEADAIIMGPGDLYTSIIPNVLVRGMSQALKKSKAKKIYISNLMTKFGETNGFAASDFARELLSYAGLKKFDAIIVNTGRIPPAVRTKYAREKAYPVVVDQNLRRYAKKIVRATLFRKGSYVRHDSAILADMIMKLV